MCLVSDVMGSTVETLNAAEYKLGSYSYEQYRKTTVSGTPNGNPYQFIGREAETNASGLYYMRARYYNPTLGRFISPDPLGIAGGLNVFAHAGSDPVNS